MKKLRWMTCAMCVALGLWLADSSRLTMPAPQSVAAISVSPTAAAQGSLSNFQPAVNAAAPARPVPQAASHFQPDVMVEFHAWTSQYMETRAEDRPALIEAGLELARARRPVFKELIQRDPRSALAAAIPMVVRQELPPAIVDMLEERVNGRAALRVYQGVGTDNQAPVPTVRIAEFETGRVYETYAYGRRLESVRWLAGASLNGVAVDQSLAVHEDPFRTLEAGERPDPLKSAVAVCPVSGKSSLAEADRNQPITEQTPAIEVFGEIVYLCNGSHAIVYKQQLIQAEGGTGGPLPFTGILPAVPTPSIGNVKVLVIPLTFADQNDTPSTESKLYEVLRDVGDHYAKASYGKLTLLTTVTPPIKLPHNEAWYIQKDTSNGGTLDGLGLEHSHARAEARKLGFDENGFDCVVVRLRGGPRPAGGYGGGNSVWIYGDGVDVTAHEIGHSFGLAHANFWDTAGTSAIGAGANVEYGGHWDVMGGIGLPYGHYNVQAKNQIKWLPDAYVTEITGSGQYRIYAQDQAILDPAKRFALKIRKDSLRTYWGELRGLYTGHATRTWADYGFILGWRFPGGGGGNFQLIDTTPGSAFGKDDSPVSLGRTFSDFEAGIHLTTVAVNPAAGDEPKSVDIVVNMGEFPSNHPPVLALSASAAVVPLNVPVTFSATASDPDGDALAYSWQHFGDANYRTISSNAPVITRVFTSAGTYVVTCTVSDMQGGTATRNVLVTVGNGNGRFTISGQITLSGRGLANVLVNANNANAVVTDNDGRYTIPNLAAGTYVLTALLAGYSFSELFNNSIVVGPSFAGADFEAAETPRVTIEATVRSVNETNAASPAQFTLRRTGDTAQALTVNVLGPLGTATRNTDYTISPSPTNGSQGFSTLTIPADQDTLVVSIIPTNDVVAEGPETVVLELAPGIGYVLQGLARATVVIDDDDTTLPKVSLAVGEAKTVEGSTNPATIVFTRTGSTTGALAVPYFVSGTATSSLDFQPLPGTLTIPAGSAAATLPVLSVDDALAESLETVTITITGSATLIADPVANSATVFVVDDDLQVVTVAATDAVATERDLSIPGAVADTATFIITRAGDFTSPLTVYYAVAGVNTGTVATALHGVDYEALPGILTIPAGQASGAVTIIPRWDGLGEGPESVTLQLGAGPTNYRLGNPNSATITINDAGDPPYVEVLGIDNAVESGTVGHFRFSVKGSVASNLVVRYSVSGTATGGVDFVALPGTVTISGNGVNTVDINVTPINDANAEELKTITVSLTPDPAYQVFVPSSSATIWMMDDERPTVFVDAHANNYPPTITEGGAAGAFYLSRTGSTNAALTVNYSVSGTASNGVDYQAVSGVAIIPAGALGVDVPITTINDSLAEGTEAISLSLEPGLYGRGQPATLYLADNETPTVAVGFTSAGATGLESVETVNIPVTLSAASAAPITVEYLVDTGTRTVTTVNGAPPSPLPYWVRCDRVGNNVIGSISSDGANWTSVSTQVVAMSSSSYLAGLYVCSFNTSQLSTGVFDNVVITNLTPGGSQGARVSLTVGTTALAGSASVVGGVYTVAGAGDNVEGTTDQGFFTYWPISNSTNCTIIARVVSQRNTSVSATAGVMIREGTANNVRRGYMAATPGSGMQFHYRTAASATEAKVTSLVTKPLWARLQRAGGVVMAFQSNDGISWSPVSTNLDLAFGSEVVAGLAVSAQAEGTLATAVLDNVSITPGPTPGLQGRTIGFTAIQGVDSLSNGVYTITASADGINGTSDDCYFVAAPVAGDFILTARVTSLQSSAATPQAGVMVRENTTRRARSAFLGGVPGTTPQLAWRSSTTTAANAAGLDFALTEGLLTFAPGTITQYLTLTVTNDTRPEPDEAVTLVLRNSYGARLGQSQFTYVIVDDDSPPPLPLAGFAAGASGVRETNGLAPIPVSLSVPATGLVTLDYSITAGTATDGADFVAATGSLVFEAGETVKNIPLQLLDDASIESSKTVVLALSNPTGALINTSSNHTVTISDDDSAVVTISSTDTNAAEAGDTARVIITRTGPLDNPLVVNLIRSGGASVNTDYTGIDPTATIPTGASNVMLTLTPVQDVVLESTETASIAIGAGVGYVIGNPSSVTLFIADDDRNTVLIEATGPTAVEGGTNGVLTLTRLGNTNASLTVNLTVTGTATSGSDYTTSPSPITPVVFAAGQNTRTININPINDALTEGNEAVLVQIAAGGYDIGGAGYATVILQDNDIPPTVFIASPGAQGVVIAPGNGVELVAVAEDDGLPQPLSYSWTQVAGPGSITFGAAAAAATPALFSTSGVYWVRVTVSDGQFSASDQIAVNVGGTSNLTPAQWMSADIGPTTARGYAGPSGSNWVLAAAGTGFASSSDRAYAVTRAVAGDATISACVLSISGPSAAEAGVSVRDSLHRYARRAALVYQASTRTLRFRPRLTSNTTDTNASVANLSLPLWLKLDRVASNNTVTAYYATNNAGAPGPWTAIGSPTVIAMDAAADYSLVAASGSDTVLASATFNSLSLTPEPVDPAVLAEDFGAGTQAGSYAYNPTNDTHTLLGQGSLDGSGMFWGQQFMGDFVLTVLQLDVTSSASSARTGLMIRDSMDDGPMAFLGRIPTGSYNSYVWRTNPKGGTSGLNGITQKKRWLRFIRRGSQVTALHAPDNSGVPGAWVQLGQPQTVFLTPAVLAGLYCDNAGGVGLNTATFTKFSIVPLNLAPIVAITAPTNVASPLALTGSVSDDGLPTAFTAAWTAILAPGPVSFADSNAPATAAAFSAGGNYTLRLWADDGLARTFSDLSFAYFNSPFQAWQAAYFAGGLGNTNNAPEADPDHDGLNNLGEYAFGSNPNQTNESPLALRVIAAGTNEYLRLSVPKNSAATDVAITVEAAAQIPASNWSINDLIIEQNDATNLVVRDGIPINGATQRYLRVKVTLSQ